MKCRCCGAAVFGDRVEMVANFSGGDHAYLETIIPGRSVLARWLETGEARIFMPPAPLS